MLSPRLARMIGYLFLRSRVVGRARNLGLAGPQALVGHAARLIDSLLVMGILLLVMAFAMMREVEAVAHLVQQTAKALAPLRLGGNRLGRVGEDLDDLAVDAAHQGLVGCGADGVANSVGVRRAVRNDRHPIHAQQRRAAIL